MGNVCMVSVKNVYRLLPLAHEYQIQKILDRCEAKLMREDPSISLIGPADDYGLPKLRAHLINVVGRKFTLDEINDKENTAHLSDKSRSDLLTVKVETIEESLQIRWKLRAALKAYDDAGHAKCRKHPGGCNGSECSGPLEKKKKAFYDTFLPFC